MKKLLFVLVLFASSVFAQEVLDKVVAVVDNEIITQSELNFKTAIVAAQQKKNPNDPQFKRQILNSIIDEKLMLAQAKLDSVTVSDDEVNRRLDYQIDMFIQQYGSREKVEQVYGMSIEKIRRELRDEVRNNLMAQSIQQKKFGFIEVGRREVEEFFEIYKDSLGMVPEKYSISHIFVNPKASDVEKKKARDFAQNLLDSIKNGADFGELAKKYSEDPGTAQNGGELGVVKRGRLVPQYEAAAFAMREGQVSELVESMFGFHIIQLLEKKGESINTRHILIKIKSDEDADLRTIEFLSDLRDSIRQNKGSFADFATKYSDDKQTSKFGGKLGTFEKSQLDKNLFDTVTKLREGEISYPKRIELGQGIYGYHIIRLNQKVAEHEASLEKDYEEIKQLAEYHKQEKLYAQWMEELKDKIYWEIKI